MSSYKQGPSGMLVCVTDYLILSFGAVEAFLDDNKLILFFSFISVYCSFFSGI
ncbi:hypothetical protein AAJ76_1600005850 [Vairimorpha ceranae]|uniref:Uncharacterized protein n=1 Tax=Vairimorpha ceranae TaxID=40302 RepID=A0A0F9WLK4_9MICR|nr:hypothetical protein AAJ76_1600005850 [Vairimorpha ceranae]KKO73958.1 hypothetical protein AAJ76_1600005850 [Vairimorpha ceranae]